MVHLSERGKQALDTLLVSKSKEAKVPALHFGVTTANGVVYFNCAGDRVYGEPDKGQVDENTTLQLMSMTKFVTTLASLHLVEKGLLSLDDPQLIEEHLPDLCRMPVMDDCPPGQQPIFHIRQKPITLRLLLSHQSGLSYEFNDPNLATWAKEHKNGMSWLAPHATPSEFCQPLAFEPGTQWRYSIGLDWAGILIERVTKKTLDEVFQETIFRPLGIEGQLSFYPTEDIKSRLQPICNTVGEEGKLIVDWEAFRPRPWSVEELGQHPGGAGLFGTAKAYLRLLQGVLACRDQEGGILSPVSFKELFTNSLPPRPARQYSDMASIAIEQGFHDPAHLSGGTGDFIEHSVGLFVNTADSCFGRKAGSGCWDGAARTMFWLDPTTGIAAVCCTQLLTHGVHEYTHVYNQFERALYDGLEK